MRVSKAAIVLLSWTLSSVIGCSGRAQASTPLLLEVSVNGAPTHLVGNFVQSDHGRIGAKLKELKAIGLLAPRGTGNSGIVFLNTIPGVSFVYDQDKQTIDIKASQQLLAPHEIDAGATQDGVDGTRARRNFGALLNYTFFASGAHDFQTNTFTYSGASASLDGRLFTTFGTASQTAILGNTTTSHRINVLRLVSTWTYSDQNRLLTYRVGDMISGGLAWTRPVRLGGFQLQKNFELRPDLVTLALPSVSGSAAVPSSIDIYVNGAKTFSQEVNPGPFQINNLPAVSGAGAARVVVRDASGRQIETNLPFFVSSKILAPGLFDFSAEAGFPRVNYGSKSFDYFRTPVGSASGRYGYNDRLTFEGHAEASPRLVNGGLGADIRTGDFGVLSLAVAGSRYLSQTGAQLYGAYDLQLWNFTVSAATQRTFGPYMDIAAITAPKNLASNDLSTISQVTGLANFLDLGSALPPKAIDRISVGVPLLFDRSSINVSFANVVQADQTHSQIASTSWSHSVPFGATLFATAFVDLANRKNMGIFAGISIPFGSDASASTGVSRDQNGWTLGTQVTKAVRSEPGSYGWSVSDSEGATRSRAASATYRSSLAQVQVGAAQVDSGVQGSAQIDGSVAMGGGDVFLAPRVTDAFGIVKVGAPNVDVEVENRPAGRTGANGDLLAPDLRSFQKNKITIDPGNLPLNATIGSTKEVVTPADGGLVIVNFGVNTHVKTALVTLVQPDGKPLPAGSLGAFNGKSFVIGYDGQAFIIGLSRANVVSVSSNAGKCSASFTYKPDGALQVQIGPVICR